MTEIKPSSLSMLMFRYQSPAVPLERVVADFFTHLDLPYAKKRAARQDFPFPVFKVEKSRNAPYMVSVEALATYLDRQAQTGQQDHENMHR